MAKFCLERGHYTPEFPESLVSDSKFRDSQWKTRNRTRIGPRYFSIQSLGIGIEADLKEENVIIYGFLRGKKQNLTRNSKTLGSRLGIGLGIEITSSLCSVSD